MGLPTRGSSSAIGEQRSVEVATLAGATKRPTERLLAFGALTVSVVEDLNVAGYPPERFTVTVGGRPLPTIACGYEIATGRRWIETELGLVVVPSAQDRRNGACLTVNGMPIPGS